MAQAQAPALDRDDHVALLTDMIFSAVGERNKLDADDAARAAAVHRVQTLLLGLIAKPAEAAPLADPEDWTTDILFGRMDAEYLFREPGAGA